MQQDPFRTRAREILMDSSGIRKYIHSWHVERGWPAPGTGKVRAGLLDVVCSVAARWYVISEPAWPLLGCFPLRHVHQATAGATDFRCVRLVQSGRLVVVGLCMSLLPEYRHCETFEEPQTTGCSQVEGTSTAMVGHWSHCMRQISSHDRRSSVRLDNDHYLCL